MSIAKFMTVCNCNCDLMALNFLNIIHKIYIDDIWPIKKLLDHRGAL